jgi:ATP-binding cassette subfamily B (MDR/TAP) protein 1
LATKFATDSFAFQGAIGEKVSTIIMTFAMFVAGFAIAFSKGWLMTLVTLCSLPAIAFGGYLYASAITSKDKDQEKEYAEAGGQAEQAIAAIKTVKQLNGEEFEAMNYANTLKDITKKALRYGAYLGIGLGALFLTMLWSYGLGFWFGSHCVEDTSSCPSSLNGGSAYSAGDVLVIFFSILMAGFNLSQLTPSIKKIAEGQSAGARIFAIIDRQPLIMSAPDAIKPTDFKGVFRFEGVTFAYPKDKSKNILENLNLIISAKSIGFVGESGCGKSTIFQLLMRFYDPDEGRITLDGVDLRKIDLFWLRDQIGYVGQ